MTNKNDIIKSALGLFSKGRVPHDKKFTNPRRDWFIGLLFFLVIVTAGGVYSAHTFVTYRNLNTDGGDYNESLVRYNKNLIEEVLAVYEARKESFDALRKVNTPVVAVPPEVPEPTAPTTQQVSSSSEPLPADEVEMAI